MNVHILDMRMGLPIYLNTLYFDQSIDFKWISQEFFKDGLGAAVVFLTNEKIGNWLNLGVIVNWNKILDIILGVGLAEVARRFGVSIAAVSTIIKRVRQQVNSGNYVP